MRADLLALLRCPTCAAPLTLRDPVDADDGIRQGTLICAANHGPYPIVAGVPRFVPEANYASSFGFQWNRFHRTQLDSHSGLSISRDRFYAQSRWTPDDLRGKRLLDVGCGSGRFAEVALAAGARVVALDYSSAVDACHANLGHHPACDVVQGDVYRLPFAPGSFDFVYCYGVLQHTPDPSAAFHALVRQVTPGGWISVDVYPNTIGHRMRPKYLLRPMTSRLTPAALFALTERWVPRLLPVSRVLGRVPLVGRWLRNVVPVANYEGVYPLSEQQLLEWAVLDTFDMLSPAYDRPQSAATLLRWLEEAGLEPREVHRVGHVVATGRRPPSSRV
jgi:SAM-dependent methyltransferase